MEKRTELQIYAKLRKALIKKDYVAAAKLIIGHAFLKLDPKELAEFLLKKIHEWKMQPAMRNPFFSRDSTNKTLLYSNEGNSDFAEFWCCIEAFQAYDERRAAYVAEVLVAAGREVG